MLSIPASATGFIKETGDVPYDTFTYWDGANVASTYAVRATGMFDYYDVFFSEDFEGVNIASYTDVSVDKNDNVYILDSVSSAVHVFDKDYNFVKTIGKLVVNDRFTTSTVAYDSAVFADVEAIAAAIEAGTVYGKACEVAGYKGCIELTKTLPTGKVVLKAIKATTIPNGDAGIKFAVIKAD